MALNDWSEKIIIAELTDDPPLADDLDVLWERLQNTPESRLPDVVLDFRNVSRLNSSHIAQLLRVRKRLLHADRRLRVCCVSDPVWAIIIAMGIDGLFTFNDDVSTALASLTMAV